MAAYGLGLAASRDLAGVNQYGEWHFGQTRGSFLRLSFRHFSRSSRRISLYNPNRLYR